MIAQLQPHGRVPPALVRLSNLGPLDASAERAIREALTKVRTVGPRTEIVTEGRPIEASFLVTAGWAARVRGLRDGRRQFLSFLLPGDFIGLCRHSDPLAVSSVVALTELRLCPAPLASPGPCLSELFARSLAVEEAYLLEQIMRLGRFTAQERIASLFLELHERLTASGLAHAAGFDLPLTQEVLADALGLTSVHINRMLKELRRNDAVVWRNGHVRLARPEALAYSIGRVPARVINTFRSI